MEKMGFVAGYNLIRIHIISRHVQINVLYLKKCMVLSPIYNDGKHMCALCLLS